MTLPMTNSLHLLGIHLHLENDRRHASPLVRVTTLLEISVSTKTSSSRRIYFRKDRQATGGNPVIVPFFFPQGKTRTGSPLPMWRQHVADGRSATTLFSGNHTLVELKNGTAKAYRWMPAGVPRAQQKIVEFYSENYAQQNSPAWFNSASEAEALNQCMTRFYKALRQEMYQISGPTFLGELRESIQMIRKPMQGLRDYAQSYLSTLDKKRRRARGRPVRGYTTSLSRTLADTWLEFSFGWSPFLSDIKAGAETLARLNYDKRRSNIKAYGESARLLADVTYDSLTTSSGIAYFNYVRQSNHKKIIQRAGLDATLTAPTGSIARVIELSGFSFQNFVPTAWELLPWSFFIDYFSNIGDVITSQMTDTSKVTWTCRSSVTEIVDARWARANVNRTKSQVGGDFILCDGGELGLTRSIYRTVTRTGDGPTYPTLSFSLPGLPAQIANISALLVSGRKLQPFR